jgi:hypothetical protein
VSPKREYDGHSIEQDPLRHVYQRIGNNVSRRHAGCTFSTAEVRDILRDPDESTGVPQADDEIREEATADELRPAAARRLPQRPAARVGCRNNQGGDMSDKLAFIYESNRIEGIHRDVLPGEVASYEELLAAKRITVPALERFVSTVAGVELRKRQGMNVRVGSYLPPPGGREIPDRLRQLLSRTDDSITGRAWSPYELHTEYERLHPFMDGNGRSGRALWAWHRRKIGRDPFELGFLHSWYYESLDAR